MGSFRIHPRAIICDTGFEEEPPQISPYINASTHDGKRPLAGVEANDLGSMLAVFLNTEIHLDGKKKEIGSKPTEGRTLKPPSLDRSDLFDSSHPSTPCRTCNGRDRFVKAADLPKSKKYVLDKCGIYGSESWLDLCLSAERGCAKCGLMKEIIPTYEKNIGDPKHGCVILGIGFRTPYLGFRFGDDGRDVQEVEIFVLPGEFSPGRQGI